MIFKRVLLLRKVIKTKKNKVTHSRGPRVAIPFLKSGLVRVRSGVTGLSGTCLEKGLIELSLFYIPWDCRIC